MLDLCCQHYKILLMSGRHISRSVQTEPVEQGWNMVEVGRSGWNTASRQTRNLARRIGGFASEDLRLKEAQLVEKEEQQDDGQVQAEATAGEKNKVAKMHIEKVLQGVAEEMQHAGTISDYMGNMSMASDSSLESEFDTLKVESIIDNCHK